MSRGKESTGAPLSPSAIRAGFDEIGHGARKRFGQHFLANRHVSERIIALAGIEPSDAVVEIGPGLGALTDALAAASRLLWLIEVDRDLAQRAAQRYASSPSVSVVCGDALAIDYATLLGDAAPALLVANLPYNVGTPIVMQAIEPPSSFRRLVVMLQLEVAQRLVAAPGSKVYGLPSVMAQSCSRARIEFRVPPSAFVPRPKVESAVVRIEPGPPPCRIDDRTTLRNVARAAFGQRRKQLANSLGTAFPDAAKILDSVGIARDRRPETLALSEFAAIANEISTRERRHA